MSRRGALALLLAVSVLATPALVQAQSRIARIGYLSPPSETADEVHTQAFRQGLHDLGISRDGRW